jgi:3-dehydroquinate dehydratase/shikimate dehydrogenase
LKRLFYLGKPIVLCVTVTAPTTAELRRRRDEAAGADMVELRLDTVADPDVAGALAGRRLPVIITCRPVWEGGHFRGSEGERRAILRQALAAGAEYVDVEWNARFDDLIDDANRHRVVVSNHDFDGVPADLSARAAAMRATGAGIIKLAIKTGRLADCLPLLELGAGIAQDGVVLVGMGECGLVTRVLAARFGSRWTYAGLEQRVGQVTPAELLGLYRYRSLTAATQLYGLVGSPVSHSASPAMHNAAFESLGIDAVYLPFPAADADDFVTFGRALGVRGASVTIPYKVALRERVDENDAIACRVGAVNTIRATNGRWIGSNTDAAAFLRPLRSRARLSGARVAVVGAGGSARAVLSALAESGAAVSVHARNAGRAEDVAKTTNAAVGPFPPRAGSWDVLVNCTPVGMFPDVDATPVAADALSGRTARLVYDLIYNPIETRLLSEAAAAGCDTIGGLEMLVGQAVEQFEWWTGAKAPAEVMQAAARKKLAEFTRDENHVV